MVKGTDHKQLIYFWVTHHFLKTNHNLKTLGGREAQIKKEGGQTAKLIREVEVKKSRGIHSNQNLSRAQLTLGRWRRRRRRNGKKQVGTKERHQSSLAVIDHFYAEAFSPSL